MRLRNLNLALAFGGCYVVHLHIKTILYLDHTPTHMLTNVRDRFRSNLTGVSVNIDQTLLTLPVVPVSACTSWPSEGTIRLSLGSSLPANDNGCCFRQDVTSLSRTLKQDGADVRETQSPSVKSSDTVLYQSVFFDVHSSCSSCCFVLTHWKWLFFCSFGVNTDRFSGPVSVLRIPVYLVGKKKAKNCFDETIFIKFWTWPSVTSFVKI